MIAPSFALTVTERVLPRMALDFTTANLDPRVTFTRSGNNATVVNSIGFVVGVNANLPRFDYDPVTKVCKGLLIEESRTNGILVSEDISSLSWNKTNINTTGTPAYVDVVVSPSNVQNADKIIESTANGFHFISQAYIAVNTTITFSAFLKAGERTQTLFQISNNATGAASVQFNLSNGTIAVAASNGGDFTASSATITNYGNGWYRCSITTTKGLVNADAWPYIYVLDAGGGASYTGDGTSGIYVWGAQMEVGAFATSYIPTVASQVTRTADVAVMTSTNFSSWYTATTGAAVVWSIPQSVASVRPLIQFDDTTANEIIALRGNIADPELYIVDGGAAQAQIDTGTIVANTAYKLCGAWNTNSCAAAQNGGTVGTDNTATIPTPTQLRIGSDGVNYASAWIQKVMYYPQRIINAEVQTFSK